MLNDLVSKPKAPRDQLTWDNPVSGLACAYLGLECAVADEAIDKKYKIILRCSVYIF